MQAGGPGGRMAAPRAMLRPFLLAAIAYLLAATAIGVALAALPAVGLPVPFGLRLAHVHLALVGSISQAMLGSIPFFGVALLATLPPDARLARLQWWLANIGTLALAAGFIGGWPAGSLIGGSLYALATIIAAVAIGAMIRRSVIGRRLDAWYYFSACIFGFAAMLLGLLLVVETNPDLLPRSGLRLAHLHLGLVGWVSLTIVGTMHTFFHSIIGAPSGKRASFIATFWLLVVGTCGLALGLLWLIPLAIAGGLAIAVAGVLFVSDVIAFRRARPGPLPLAGAHLFAAPIYFAVTALAGLFLIASAALGRPTDSNLLVAYAHLATVGWVLQTLIGALVHLIPVLAGGPTRAGEAGNTVSPYASARAIMEAAARWQFWLLNCGLWLFVASLVAAPWYGGWPWPLLAGALAVLSALIVFAIKVLTVFKKLAS